VGVQPATVLGVIARSLGLAEPGEQPTAEDLLDRFDPEALPRRPWIVDPATLTSGR
jgi:glutamyl-tRNA synthetase